MNNERTITVVGHFDDVTLTKDGFTQRWMDHFREFSRLGFDPAWSATMDQFGLELRMKCEAEFETIYKQQQEQEQS